MFEIDCLISKYFGAAQFFFWRMKREIENNQKEQREVQVFVPKTKIFNTTFMFMLKLQR